MLEGVNDIGFSESDTPTYTPAPVVSADELIAGYRRLIKQAHAKDVKVVGATRQPFKNSDHWGEHAATVSDAVNQWIRTSNRTGRRCACPSAPTPRKRPPRECTASAKL